jgi:hypothetical protein
MTEASFKGNFLEKEARLGQGPKPEICSHTLGREGRDVSVVSNTFRAVSMFPAAASTTA